jgi:proteasome lid subunit RPN8/RPN11
MSEPGFKVEADARGLPFRQRTAFVGYHRFEERGETAVLVEQEVARLLRDTASDAHPFETGGLIAGRVFQDADGRFVVVSGFVEAGQEAGGPGTFTMSPMATDRLRGEASRLFPAADVVGWWHCHSGPSHYSRTDKATQAIWTQPDSVGLLVFAEGRPWGRAYLGPDARPVTQLTIPRGNNHGGIGTGRWRPHASPRSAPGGGPRPAGAPRSVGGRVPVPSSRTLIRVVIGLAIAVLLLGIAADWAHNLSTTADSDQQEISSLSSRIGTSLSDPVNPRTVVWRCLPITTHGFECVSTLTGGWSGTVQWLVNGVPYSNAADITVYPPADSPQVVVQLEITTPAGTYDCGSQTL